MLFSNTFLARLVIAINASPLPPRDSTEAVNLGEGTCAAVTSERGPVEGWGACTNISDDGCCTLDNNYSGGSSSWATLLTSGSHGHMQVFSDANCSEDASPIVAWNEGACVDTNNSGKDIGSIRATS